MTASLVHDWNRTERAAAWPRRPRVVDETLRDGLQSPSAIDPPLAKKIDLVHLMAKIGVDVVSVGLPAAGARAAQDAAALAREIHDARLPLVPTAAARTVESDIRTIADVSARAGVPIEVYAFLGSSPIRQLVEGWDLDFLITRVRIAAATARRAGLPMCLVTEDTTRTPPDVLAAMFKAAVDEGASRLCLCDTVGHVDPHGVATLVEFVRDTLDGLGASHVELDWHGHNDRGLALANALAAAACGVRRVHGTALGIGERCGNTPMEHLVVNLAEAGAHAAVDRDALDRYCALASEAIGAPDAGAAARASRARAALPDEWSHDAQEAPADEEPLVHVRMHVNGDAVRVAVPPSRTLLEVLRRDLDLVGTKQGCDKGDCGACTVLVDGSPVLSCLTLAAECDGRAIATVESLAGAPHPDALLDEFDRCGAAQCGFCTSGMLMTAKALLRENDAPTRDEIKHAISGNLCRCTGYGAIVTAIERASKRAR